MFAGVDACVCCQPACDREKFNFCIFFLWFVLLPNCVQTLLLLFSSEECRVWMFWHNREWRKAAHGIAYWPNVSHQTQLRWLSTDDGVADAKFVISAVFNRSSCCLCQRNASATLHCIGFHVNISMMHSICSLLLFFDWSWRLIRRTQIMQLHDNGRYQIAPDECGDSICVVRRL